MAEEMESKTSDEWRAEAECVFEYASVFEDFSLTDMAATRGNTDRAFKTAFRILERKFDEVARVASILIRKKVYAGNHV